MRILYIGEPQTHFMYLNGTVPSHWLYGACEMEQDGHEVVWEKERKKLLNDMRLIGKYRPDMTFIPNLNIHNHLLLLLFASLGIYRKPVFAYLHRGPARINCLRSFIYRFLLHGLSHIFFLSEKTMQEAIAGRLIKKEKCSVPGWGADMAFFSKVKTADNGTFVSTGKENRDFDTLIEAFRRTGAPLTIITAKEHNGSNYEDLAEKCRNIDNIKVIITENTGNVYPEMLRMMADAKALVCPLRRDRINYCVGLSTISDAEGLRKPLIITMNQYHNIERTNRFCVVDSVEDWIKAIRRIIEMDNSLNSIDPVYSMQSAYDRMKRVIFR